MFILTFPKQLVITSNASEMTHMFIHFSCNLRTPMNAWFWYVSKIHLWSKKFLCNMHRHILLLLLLLLFLYMPTVQTITCALYTVQLSKYIKDSWDCKIKNPQETKSLLIRYLRTRFKERNINISIHVDTQTHKHTHTIWLISLRNTWQLAAKNINKL